MTDVRLIVGPPGTGKTRALTTEAEQAGAEYSGADVAICSLTRTAAKEIAARVDIPDENVGTLHSHAFRALGRPDLAETPEGLKAWAEAHPELKLTGGRGTVDDLDAPTTSDDTGRTPADQLHQAVMNHRARQTPVEAWAEHERGYFETWEDWKRETDRLDFTDLIEHAYTDVDQHPAHPRTMLGDEAQDFSTLELALFRKWAAKSERAVIAADPDQTIYAWRGSDPQAFSRIPDENCRILGQSYRVPQAVHQAASSWISQITDRRDAPYLPRVAAGRLTTDARTLGYVDPLIGELQAHTGDDQTSMLLASCAYMLTPALRALKAAGVPFHNPLRPERGAWNPLRGARRLAAFLRPREDVWGDHARAWTWDDLRAWTEPLAAKGALSRGSKSLIDEKCREDKFGQSRAGEEVSIDALCNILDDPGTLRHPAFRCSVDWWESKLLASKRGQMSYPITVYRQLGGAALLERPRVIVGTIHSVKGGEADHVYLSPDLSPTAMWEGWHRGGPPAEHIVRTFYVGLTRARETVTVLSPSGQESLPVDRLAGRDQMAAAA